MTTDFSWWGGLIRNSLGASWKCSLRPPAPKCTLFKDFLSIKHFLGHTFIVEGLTFEVQQPSWCCDLILKIFLESIISSNVIWYCFLEKICWRQCLLWLLWQTISLLVIGQGRSCDLNTALRSPLIMTCPLWSAEAAIRGHYHDQAPDPGASCPGENILLN